MYSMHRFVDQFCSTVRSRLPGKNVRQCVRPMKVKSTRAMIGWQWRIVSQLFTECKQPKMADSAGSSILQSRQADSSENKDDSVDVSEPEPKKRKHDNKDQPVDSKLEDRLSGILCCAVCLDVPCLWMYQASVYRFYRLSHGHFPEIYYSFMYSVLSNVCLKHNTQII